MFIDGVVHEHARQHKVVFNDDEQWLLDTAYKHVTAAHAITKIMVWNRWSKIEFGKIVHFVNLSIGLGAFRTETINQHMHGFVNYNCAVNCCEFLSGFSDKIMHDIANDLLGFPVYSPLCGRNACVNDRIHILKKCGECAKLINPTIIEMATECFVKRDYDIMPIMADALEDQGCTNETILDHCRSSGPHGRGCWVLRHLLSPPKRKKGSAHVE